MGSNFARVHVRLDETSKDALGDDAQPNFAQHAHTESLRVGRGASTTNREDSPVKVFGKGSGSISLRFDAPEVPLEERVQAPGVEPFETPEDMVKAMQETDEFGRRRYEHDSVFRQMVEARIAATNYSPELGFNPREEEPFDFGPADGPDLPGDSLTRQLAAWRQTRGW